jgi:hypothetical protein
LFFFCNFFFSHSMQIKTHPLICMSLNYSEIRRWPFIFILHEG